MRLARTTLLTATVLVASGLTGVTGLVGSGASPAQAATGQAAYAPPRDCRQTAPAPTPAPAPSTTSPSPGATPTPTPPPTPAPPRTPDSFTPRNGTMHTNNPLGRTADRRVNETTIVRSINSSPTCSTIQLATWNYHDSTIDSALRNAVKRGVTVQLVMSQGNDGPPGSATDNPPFRRMQAFLAASNVDPAVPASRRNWARTCSRACRYAGGAAHSKFYAFSQVGSARDVVHYGSHNLTTNAALYQWNDLYTVVGSSFYSFMTGIFDEMANHERTTTPFRRGTFGNLTMGIFGYHGPGATGDPVMNVLSRVRCTRAGSVGAQGRTAIRVSVAAILGQRGLDLARKLVALRRAGCNIKVLSTNLGAQVVSTLVRGGVPTRQLARYDDRQQAYVRYVHTKVVAISGNYGGRPNQQVSWNGSGNWTASTLDSDETFGQVTSSAITNKYNNFVNYWFIHTPMGRRLVPTYSETDGRLAPQWGQVEQDF